MRRMSSAVLLLCAATVSAEEWSVDSPDVRQGIVLARQADGRLTFRVLHRGLVVVPDSALGLRRADQSFLEGLAFVRDSRNTSIEDRYETPHGKRRLHVVRANQRTLTFRNASGAQIEVVLRAHDDGVAFRYRFPETDATPRRWSRSEPSSTSRPGPRPGCCRITCPPATGRRTRTSSGRSPRGHAAPEPAGWAFPALFKTTGGTWLLITEAALDESYCGSRFAADAPGGVYRLRSRTREGTRRRQVEPDLDAALDDALARRHHRRRRRRASPNPIWCRTSRRPRASRDTSWIKPGRASWSWWSESDSPKHAEDLNALHRPRGGDGLGVRARGRELELHGDRHRSKT